MLSLVADVVCCKCGCFPLTLVSCLFTPVHVILDCSAIIGRSTKDFKTCLLNFIKFMPLVSVVVVSLKLVSKSDLKVLFNIYIFLNLIEQIKFLL